MIIKLGTEIKLQYVRFAWWWHCRIW